MDSNHPNVKPVGDAVVQNEQQRLSDQKPPADVIEARKKEINAVLLSGFKSPFALVTAIAMTVLTVCCFVEAILYGDFISSSINILIGAVALVDCFGIWKLWAYDKQVTPQGLKAFQRYISLQKALNVISMVLFGLLSGVMLVIAILLMIAFDRFGDSIGKMVYSVGSAFDYEILADSEAFFNSLGIGPTVLFITGLVVVIFTTVYYTLFNRALKNVIRHVDRLAACTDGDGDYTADKKPPFISLLIFGGINALLSLFIPLGIGLWIIIYNLALGVYFVFIALLFRKIHNQIQSRNDAIDEIVTAINDNAEQNDDEQCLSGIATHAFMHHCDPERLHRYGAFEELCRLVADKALSPESAARVDLDDIDCFRKSALLGEMRQAKKLYREHRIDLPKKLIDKKSPSSAIIDCIIVTKKGDILLVDFKTADMTEKELIDEYTPQLTKYKKAIEIDFKKAPSLVAIYSFPLGKTIEIQINE